MQVRADDLGSQLQGGLRPVYLVSGDETLLVEEACDLVIAAARDQGYLERSVHYVEAGFKWHELRHASASLSLFAERKLLDVRVPVKRFDREGSDALREWLDAATSEPPDVVLLLRCGRLEPRQRSSAWFKAIEKQGIVTLIWPLSPDQLPRWLQQRARGVGLQIEGDALHYLCERVEGNLLAAAQEVDKLVLLEPEQPVSLEAVVAALEDASRFTPFDLIDATMVGDAAKIHRVVRSLRDTGTSVFAVLGAFTSQLRRGNDTRGLPPQRRKLVSQFMARIKDPAPVLGECALIDQQGKGQKPGIAWISLENLLLRLSGIRSLPLPSQDMDYLLDQLRS
jgi:DNA polymerase-3 subunit delta